MVPVKSGGVHGLVHYVKGELNGLFMQLSGWNTEQYFQSGSVWVWALTIAISGPTGWRLSSPSPHPTFPALSGHMSTCCL